MLFFFGGGLHMCTFVDIYAGATFVHFGVWRATFVHFGVSAELHSCILEFGGLRSCILEVLGERVPPPKCTNIAPRVDTNMGLQVVARSEEVTETQPQTSGSHVFAWLESEFLGVWASWG